MRINEYVKMKDEELTREDIAEMLGMTTAAISIYANKKSKPRLDVARRIYKLDQIVIYPYSEEAVKNED